MKRDARQRSDETTDTGSSTKAHGGQFIAVRDSRNRRVPGLYTRNGRYYAQLWVSREDGGKTARKYPLLTPDDVPVANLNEAKEAADVLRNDRRKKALPTSGHKPKIGDYVESYFIKPNIKLKKPGTLQNERQALKRWKEHLGDVRIDRIAAGDIAAFRDNRLRGNAHPRTVNLDLIALRNVLKAAVEDGYLREMPKAKTLKAPKAEKRPLLTPAQFLTLLAAVPGACAKNAVQFADYLRFLAYSGAREQEALKVRWDDVDLAGERVTIGSGGVSKNHETRTIEFNDKLSALLRDMKTRRAPDCSWLFPSPQRGPRDENARTFRESLLLARKAAGLPWVGFHDLRHFFASFCVMAGLDFMTIAAWLGHKDGGILVGKVYGHLLDDHRKQAARKVVFDLAVVEAA
jgi:integrase